MSVCVYMHTSKSEHDASKYECIELTFEIVIDDGWIDVDAIE